MQKIDVFLSTFLSVALKFILKVENFTQWPSLSHFCAENRKLLPLPATVCTSLESCPLTPMDIGAFCMPKSSQELVLHTIYTVSVLTITCSQIKYRLPMSCRRVSVCHVKYHNVGQDTVSRHRVSVVERPTSKQEIPCSNPSKVRCHCALMWYCGLLIAFMCNIHECIL